MAKAEVAITGANGLVGSRIIELLQDDFEFFPLNWEDGFDITNPSIVSATLQNLSYDIFLHLAAYTNVDGAEKEKETAHQINVEGTRNVFEIVRGKGRKFVYMSTGFVFDGSNPPYFEDSQPNPVGYYGQTKYEGEQVVGSEGMIVRIDTPYRASFEPKKDFARTIKNLLELGNEFEMIADSLVTPTFIDDLAFALRHLLANFSSEIYHVVGADSVSPYDAGQQIAEVFGLDGSIIRKAEFASFLEGRARRPQFLDMRSRKNGFFRMRAFREGLEELKKASV